jgi:hypothetical protein
METIDDTLRISMTGWREVTGPFHSLLGLRHAMRGQYHTVTSREMVWVLVPGDRRDEYDLLQSEQRNLSAITVMRPPESIEAPCGQFVVAANGVGKHKGRCIECRQVEGLPPVQSRNSRTVVKVPEMAGTAMDMEALLVCLSNSRDEALGMATQLDAVINSVREVPQLQAELAELEARMTTYQQALSHFLGGK